MVFHEPSATQVQGPKLGAHMSISGGLPHAIDRASKTGCETLQIFTKSSNQWRARTLPDTEIQTFRTRSENTGILPIFAHASYLINVASPDQTLWRRSVSALAEELRRADLLGLHGVILHPGAYTTSTEHDGLRRISDGIGEVLTQRNDDGAALLLEHTAGQGTVLGHRFEHLQSIIEGLNDSRSVGICLDTCHLVGAGYDIISSTGYDKVFDEFNAIIGLERLRVFHLNDSKKPLGSRLDRHDNIGDGHIGIEPFRRLLQDTRFSDLPMLLETPKTNESRSTLIEADPMDIRNLTLLKTLRTSQRPS